MQVICFQLFAFAYITVSVSITKSIETQLTLKALHSIVPYNILNFFY